MAIQLSTAVRDGMLNAIEAVIGVSAVMKIFSGAQPINCAAADPSGLLCTLSLPADWMGASSGGSATKAGAWAGTASGSGTAASWRIYATNGTTCGMQGNVTDLVFDNTSIAVNQAVTINGFTMTAGNP